MKLIHYKTVAPAHFDTGSARGVAGRVVTGKADGANNFYMRVFEIAPGGFTPQHSHPWEHEIFIHAGSGEAYGNGRWNPIGSGNVIFMPANEEHQIRNTGKETLVFVCLVPSVAPEL